MLLPVTKKEFKWIVIGVELIVFVGLIVGFILLTNEWNKRKLTPEVKAELDEWYRVSAATQKLVSGNLWNSSVNEADMIADTVEAGTRMSIYTQYQLNNDRAYESIVVAGSFDSVKNKHERELIKEKLSNAFATTSATHLLEEYEPVVSGAILNWEKNGEIYSLVDINGDGSWDYMTRGQEAHFSEDDGNLVYTDDIGRKTYVQAGEAIEVFSPHFTLAAAEKLFES